jgi:glycosyltransferase involved in cell wall biosynthesis
VTADATSPASVAAPSPPGRALKVSVVISTYALPRLPLLQECVASVLAQTYRPTEVLVVADRTPGFVERLEAELPRGVRLVPNERPGDQVAARNVGLDASRGDVVVYLDDDAVADPAWLERLIAHFDDRAVAGVGGRAIPRWDERARPFWLPEELDWVVGGTHRGFADRGGPVRNIHGHNMAFLRDVLARLGGFRVGRTGGDPISADGDDAELCMRIRTAFPGAVILYEPAAKIRHFIPAGRLRIPYLIRKSFGQGVGKAIIRRMHAGNPETLSAERSYLAHLATRFLPSVGRQIARGRVRRGLGQLGAVALAVSATAVGYIITLQRRPAGSTGGSSIHDVQ